ncbi:hypothetical protein ACWEFL_22190 [Streptomyces sp. NPDC004838]
MNQPDLAEFRARVRAFPHDGMPAPLDGVTGFVPRATAYRRAPFHAVHGGIGFTREHSARLVHRRTRDARTLPEPVSRHRERLAEPTGLATGVAS